MVYMDIIEELKRAGSKEKAAHLSRFFKTGKGEYGENDVFIGVTVPEQRKIAKSYIKTIELHDIENLLDSEYHEVRLTGIILLTKIAESGKLEEAVELYFKKIECVNNWDLVDLSAPYISGKYYFDKDRTRLFEMIPSDNIWITRIAVLSTFYFIRNNDFNDTIKMADLLLNHKHDLIHKAVGWMLREIGKRDEKRLTEYLNDKYKLMPRTMLRYAIEKYPEDVRKRYLQRNADEKA